MPSLHGTGPGMHYKRHSHRGMGSLRVWGIEKISRLFSCAAGKNMNTKSSICLVLVNVNVTINMCSKIVKNVKSDPIRCFSALKACPHWFPKQDTLTKQQSKKVACFRIQSCRFRQQNILFPDTKYPLSGNSVDRPLDTPELSTVVEQSRTQLG